MVIDPDDESSSHCHLLAIVQSQLINERRDIGPGPYLRIYPNEACAVVLVHPNTRAFVFLLLLHTGFPTFVQKTKENSH